MPIHIISHEMLEEDRVFGEIGRYHLWECLGLSEEQFVRKAYIKSRLNCWRV